MLQNEILDFKNMFLGSQKRSNLTDPKCERERERNMSGKRMNKKK